MILQNIPNDLSAEELLMYLPKDSFNISIEGAHKRNSYNDIISIENNNKEKNTIYLSRKSLYNSLPEYLFHPINRFDNIPEYEKKELFTEECQKQEQEIYKAKKFFQPFDIMLIDLRMKIKKRLNAYIKENKIIIDLLSDELTKEQRENRFIKSTLIFLPDCKYIRGNNCLITLMLRKIFNEENLVIEKRYKNTTIIDQHPKYNNTLDNNLSDIYIGNTFTENILTYDIHYWSDDKCDENFLLFVKEIEIFRQFVQDYFISIENIIHFNISKDESPLKLSDSTNYNYLNYNTNI